MHCTNRNRVQVLTATALALLVTFAGGCNRSEEPLVGQFKGLDITGVPYGKDFRLTDHNQQERTLADFKGKVVMLYFGFVQCPDVCPTALSRAVETKQLLGADGERLQVIFVTVDPERDTAPILKEYMAAFDPSFLAMSTDIQGTRRTADSFRAYYKKVPTGSSYTMDHSALSYLFDPSGNLRVAMRHEQTAQDYAHDIALLLKLP